MEIVYKKLTGGCEKMKNHFFQLPFIAIFYAGLLRINNGQKLTIY